MARGWESKAVDDQIAAAETARERRAQGERVERDLDRTRRRETLRLNRARTLQLLQAACDRRHRALLDAQLADIDRQLAALEA